MRFAITFANRLAPFRSWLTALKDATQTKLPPPVQELNNAIDRTDGLLLGWGLRLLILAAFVLVATPALSIELLDTEARPKTAARWNMFLTLVNRFS